MNVSCVYKVQVLLFHQNFSGYAPGYVQSSFLKCFIVYLLSYCCLKIFMKKLLVGLVTDKCVFTGVKKMPFSRICSSTLPEKKHKNFCVNFLEVGQLQFQI